MGLYHTVCYKIEDLFVKVLSKKENQHITKEKVIKYRMGKEEFRQQRKLEKGKKKAERNGIQA
ncbi:hypothetical protein ACIQXV_20195 [Neobacillus sp. NPDC097160]|uniref:hypothetical protein n=1 Tax=Neobacillus sp. NPDC097160 TaxID=3364298 RepID=UPI00380851AD